MNRPELIARKQEVRRRLEQAERRLAALQERTTGGRGGWWEGRQRSKLEQEIAQLIVEEGALRLAIDRANPT